MIDNNFFKETILDRLPTGRAWNGTLLQDLISSVGYCNNDVYNNINANLKVCTSINLNREYWYKMFIRLPITEDEDVFCKAVLRKLVDVGAISLQSMQEQLQALGFDVYLSSNYDPTINPLSLWSNELKLVEKTTHAIEGDALAFEKGENIPELIVNYLDQQKDEKYYLHQLLFTNYSEKWKHCFFIHGKGGITTRANVSKERKQEFRELILEMKEFQSWAVNLIDWQ